MDEHFDWQREDSHSTVYIPLANSCSGSREPEQKGRGHQDQQQRGGRSRGGRGRGGDRDRGSAPKSAADLDNEMDTYMKDA